MSDWGGLTYTEMASKLAWCSESIHREMGAGVGTYDLAVAELWQELMAAATPNYSDVRELLALLEPEEGTIGLHGGTAWEELTLVIRKWAQEQRFAK